MVEGLNKQDLDQYSSHYYQDLVIHMKGAAIRVFVTQSTPEPLNADLIYLHGFSQTDVRQFLAHYCQDQSIKFLNTENAHTSPTSKLNQYYAFARHKVPYPETVVAYPPNIVKAADEFALGFPLVIKSINARGGEDNHLAKTLTELKKIVGKISGSQAYALQPFIKNDGDYRVIVFETKLVACYKRSRQDDSDHRNNVRQGAKREIVDPVPSKLAETAARAAMSLNRELTGIDILIDPAGKHYVLESNFNFGLKDEGDDVVPYVLEKLAPILHKAAK